MAASETGHVTGTADKDYNLIWFTEKCLNNALRLQTYVQDAERQGDSELAEFFRKAQADSRKGRRPRQADAAQAAQRLATAPHNSMAHAAMKNTQDNGPDRLGWQPSRAGQDHHEQPGSESGDQPDTQPASGGDGDCGETTGGMDTMFDRLRDAAAKHNDDCDLLPLIQDGAATGKQPSGCRDGHRDRPGDIAG